MAFHCQQAAEKYIKALLTFWNIEFPKTHALANLLALVETGDAALATALLPTIILTPYGVELRYPGDRPDPSVDQAREAVELAKLVREKLLPILPETPGDCVRPGGEFDGQ